MGKISYVKRPKPAASNRTRCDDLAAFIAAGTSDPDRRRPVVLRAGESVNLSELARRGNG